jgi:transcriptional regulator with XRE-family HTH domain
MITAEQLRAARAMLRMEQAELANRAAVSVETIKRLEGSDGKLKAKSDTLASIRTALEYAGVAFFDDHKRPGVRLATDPNEALKDAIIKEIVGLTDGVLSVELKKNPDVLNRGKQELIDLVISSLIPLLKHTLPTRLPGK